MTVAEATELETVLRRRLRGGGRVAVVGVGNEDTPHDRLGLLAAREVEGLRLPRVRVFHAGTVPESVTGPVRKYRPRHILLLDAADMGERPGSVAILRPDQVHAALLSTHSLPLPVVMKYMAAEAGAEAILVGIQPDFAHHGGAPSPPEQAGLARLLGVLSRCLTEREPAPRRRRQGGSAAEPGRRRAGQE